MYLTNPISVSYQVIVPLYATSSGGTFINYSTGYMCRVPALTLFRVSSKLFWGKNKIKVLLKS